MGLPGFVEMRQASGEQTSMPPQTTMPQRVMPQVVAPQVVMPATEVPKGVVPPNVIGQRATTLPSGQSMKVGCLPYNLPQRGLMTFSFSTLPEMGTATEDDLDVDSVVLGLNAFARQATNELGDINSGPSTFSRQATCESQHDFCDSPFELDSDTEPSDEAEEKVEIVADTVFKIDPAKLAQPGSQTFGKPVHHIKLDEIVDCSQDVFNFADVHDV